jgi:hypothetical protein
VREKVKAAVGRLLNLDAPARAAVSMSIGPRGAAAAFAKDDHGFFEEDVVACRITS